MPVHRFGDKAGEARLRWCGYTHTHTQVRVYYTSLLAQAAPGPTFSVSRNQHLHTCPIHCILVSFRLIFTSLKLPATYVSSSLSPLVIPVIHRNILISYPSPVPLPSAP